MRLADAVTATLTLRRRPTPWRNEDFRNYADYAAATEPFRAGMDALRALMRDHCCAVMCAEAVWWRCHSRSIADYLLTQGSPVAHMLGHHKVLPATLMPGARRLRGGTGWWPNELDQPVASQP